MANISLKMVNISVQHTNYYPAAYTYQVIDDPLLQMAQ